MAGVCSLVSSCASCLLGVDYDPLRNYVLLCVTDYQYSTKVLSYTNATVSRLRITTFQPQISFPFLSYYQRLYRVFIPLDFHRLTIKSLMQFLTLQSLHYVYCVKVSVSCARLFCIFFASSNACYNEDVARTARGPSGKPAATSA